MGEGLLACKRWLLPENINTPEVGNLGDSRCASSLALPLATRRKLASTPEPMDSHQGLVFAEG